MRWAWPRSGPPGSATALSQFARSIGATLGVTLMGVIVNQRLPAGADLEGGGRFYTQLTDGDPDALTFDLPVELTFRRFHEGGGLVNYFWKFRPLLGGS